MWLPSQWLLSASAVEEGPMQSRARWGCPHAEKDGAEVGSNAVLEARPGAVKGESAVFDVSLLLLP